MMNKQKWVLLTLGAMAVAVTVEVVREADVVYRARQRREKEQMEGWTEDDRPRTR